MRMATALLLLTLPMYAQRAGESVQVTVVEVPVTVVGANGEPLRDLTKADFELFDDGKRVDIQYFERLDMKTIAMQPPGAPLPPVATRNFLLLFDLAGSSPGSIGRAATAAAEFVDKHLGPRDLAAVATFTAEDGAKMITNFTGDKALLAAAIRTMGHPRYFKVADPLMISYDMTAIPFETTLSGHTVGENELAERDNPETELEELFAQKAEQQNFGAQVAHDAEQRNRLRIQLQNMGTVARMLDRLLGRKQIILLSEGFDAGLVHGREVSSDKAKEDTEKLLAGEVWKVDADRRLGNAGAARDVADMAELFRRSDVVLHAIDIKGVRAQAGSDVSNPHARSNESLFLITRPTGGTVFQNSNDLAQTFARMLAQQEVVYLLGFAANNNDRAGAFHSLKVKTKVRGARVTHRPGYYEPSMFPTSIERSLTTAEILMNDTPLRDVDVLLAATALPSRDGFAVVPVIVGLPGAKLLEGVTGPNATAHIFVYAFDAQKRVRGHFAQRMALDLTKVGDTLRANGIRYHVTLRLPPGEYAVKSVVRIDETGRAGFARSDLRVPDFLEPVVLPPLVFAKPDNWVMLGGGARGGDYPFVIGDAKYVPVGQPVIRANGEYDVALMLFDVAVEGLGVTATIDGEGGTRDASLTVVGRTTTDARGGTKLLFRFRPGDLQPGKYELRMNVKPRAGKESRVQMPFIVR